MTIKETAARLAELCRKGDFEAAQKELFSDDAVSLEPHASPAFDKETKGLKAILAKGKKFKAMAKETHSILVCEPLIAANSFACTMKMDITMKEGGRMDMTELCVYELKDGKIIAEHFFM